MDRNRKFGSIYCGCILDAIGSQFEGIYAEDQRLTQPIKPIKHYTDDTEMTIALLKYWTKAKGEQAKSLEIIKTFAEYATLKRGYSENTRVLLQKFKNGDIFGSPNHSDTNGCLMRASPLVHVCKDKSDKEILKIVKATNEFTHNHQDSDIATFLYIKIVDRLLNHSGELRVSTLVDKAINYVRAYIRPLERLTRCRDLCKSFEENREIKVDINTVLFGRKQVFQIKALDCLVTALSCLAVSDSPMKCVETAISLGGDVDTVLKVLGDFLGALHGWDWLPVEWMDIEHNNSIKDLINSFLDKYNK